MTVHASNNQSFITGTPFGTARPSLRRVVWNCVVLLLLATPAMAAIEGTVTNGTNGKPAAGEKVALLELAQGMMETAQTVTDSQGKFSFEVKNASAPHLVRATHQGVNYFKMVPPGTNSAAVQVFDSGTKVDGLSYVFETAYQASAGTLQTVQFFVIRNNSMPPRTQSGGNGFEIALPENAKIDSADVQPPGGQALQTAPTPKGKGRYAFDYPLRPGETTFRLMYSTPYSGEATLKPTLLYPVEQFAVITPDSMGFEAKNSGAFKNQPHQGGVNIQIATNVTPASDLSYRISGNGQMPDAAAAQGQDETGAGGDQTAAGGRPGGGLGNPINTPDPLTKYRVPLLAVFAAMLVFGAFYIIKNRQPGKSAAAAVAQDEEVDWGAVATPDAQSLAVPKNRASLLLEAMKEELFQLEVDRQQGRISAHEYSAAKQALDTTLQRALARQAGTRSNAESA